MRGANKRTVDGGRWTAAVDVQPQLNTSFILHPSSARRAFTLVELLVVIVIIGILMGLVVGAASMARNAARRAGISAEISQLDLALKKYRDTFGEYPPDCTDMVGGQGTYFMRHISRAFPKFYVPGSNPQAQFSWLNNKFAAVSGIYLANLDPSEAMVFFLGGWPLLQNSPYYKAGFSGQLVYFSSDPTDPFDISAYAAGGYARIPTSRMQPLFTFDPLRLQAGRGNLYQFFPRTGVSSGTTGNAPYVYFCATANGFDPATGRQVWGYNLTNTNYPVHRWPLSQGANLNDTTSFNGDIVYAYYQWNVTAQLKQWFMPQDYQIICGGLDNRFGCRYLVPFDLLSGSSRNRPYDTPIFSSSSIIYGFDNQTNFSSGRIEDIPK
jgi:prepilin-type N-terminal cleavage/methylation domain-containing protein